MKNVHEWMKDNSHQPHEPVTAAQLADILDHTPTKKSHPSDGETTAAPAAAPAPVRRAAAKRTRR